MSSSAEKPTPLILDSEGRTIDITGKEVQLTQVIPTLKANIRAKKREEFKQTFSEKSNDDSSELKFFDPRLTLKTNIRTKRSLKFHEPGKFQQIADRLRMKVFQNIHTDHYIFNLYVHINFLCFMLVLSIYMYSIIFCNVGPVGKIAK